MYENQNLNPKLVLKRVIILIGIFLIALLIKQILLGNYVKLGSASSLSGQVASSLTLPGNNKLPLPGKDFTISNRQYFNNNTWAIVAVTKPQTDKAYIVLEKINGVFTVVLGPGTNFPTDVTLSMPSDVAAYLINQGVVG
jgi:hypothetical protein